LKSHTVLQHSETSC